jgi:hypothetical protein
MSITNIYFALWSVGSRRGIVVEANGEVELVAEFAFVWNIVDPPEGVSSLQNHLRRVCEPRKGTILRKPCLILQRAKKSF